MTIVVHRDTGSFGVVRRMRVKLDGETVGRVRPGRTLEVTGSGAPQRLSASLDRVGSNELTVTDPGPDAVVDVDLTGGGAADSMVRTWLAPGTVLRLAPSGQPAPAPPPLRLTWRKVVRLWLVVAVGAVVWASLRNLLGDEPDDGSVVGDLVGVVIGVSVGLGLVVAVAALAVRHSRTGPRPDGSRPDGSRPDGSRPDGSRPDGSRPDGSRPDGSRPDGSRPDGSRPDGSRPDGSRPPADGVR